jgi:AraC-like DNA-binding protein
MSSQVLCPIERIAHFSQIIAGNALRWVEPPPSDQFEQLFVSIPSPTLHVARLTIESCLKRLAGKLSQTVHANFHARFYVERDCAFFSPELNLRWSDDGDVLVHPSLASWAETFRREFHRAHASAAQRVRLALESRSRGDVEIESLSRTLGIGRRTLERQFRAEVGVSIAAYRTCVKLVDAVNLLHEGDSCVESVALRTGWASKKGLYHSLHELTGLKPTDIRRLSVEQKDALLAELSSPGRSATRDCRCHSSLRFGT